jgi:hypothetical protein
MRVIKFRAWDKEDKVIDYDQCVSQSDDDVYLNGIFNDDNFIYQQFTGLKDKNRKEIYEGDFVKRGERLFEVVWSDGGYFEIKDGEYLWELNDLVVVGNIFENPELLKI